LSHRYRARPRRSPLCQSPTKDIRKAAIRIRVVGVEKPQAVEVVGDRSLVVVIMHKASGCAGLSLENKPTVRAALGLKNPRRVVIVALIPGLL